MEFSRQIAPLLMLVVVIACIEPFVPDLGNNEELLVVEGHISDRTEPYTIRLSRTQPLNSDGSEPESGAVVSVEDGENTSYFFEETSPGIYQSDPACFVGQTRQVYTLRIETGDGAVYQSDPVVLKPTPAIDSIYYEREERFTAVEGIMEDGVRIYLDAHDPTAQTRYYRYNWIETYEVKLRYPSEWEYDPSKSSLAFLRNPRINLCYAIDTAVKIRVTSTAHLKDDVVKKFDIGYVSTEGYRLKDLYSILIRQYALDEKGHKYWYELQKSSETAGTLFDPMPYQLSANVKNVTNLDEAVLGYFEASAYSEKRLFISREELLQLNTNYPRDPCMNEIDSIKTPDEFYSYHRSGWLIVGSNPTVMAPPKCSDCREHGTLQKPDFWPR